MGRCQLLLVAVWRTLRRTIFAAHARRLCHPAGGEHEQIQFLLGHISVQTTERARLERLAKDLVYGLVRRCGGAIGHPDLTSHDLRRTCAKLCRKAGELEQIQLLFGHASIQIQRDILGTKQDLVQSVNDRMKVRIYSY